MAKFSALRSKLLADGNYDVSALLNGVGADEKPTPIQGHSPSLLSQERFDPQMDNLQQMSGQSWLMSVQRKTQPPDMRMDGTRQNLDHMAGTASSLVEEGAQVSRHTDSIGADLLEPLRPSADVNSRRLKLELQASVAEMTIDPIKFLDPRQFLPEFDPSKY